MVAFGRKRIPRIGSGLLLPAETLDSGTLVGGGDWHDRVNQGVDTPDLDAVAEFESPTGDPIPRVRLSHPGAGILGGRTVRAILALAEAGSLSVLWWLTLRKSGGDGIFLGGENQTVTVTTPTVFEFVMPETEAIVGSGDSLELSLVLLDSGPNLLVYEVELAIL